MNETSIIARMHKDGTVVEILPDGSERPFPEQHMRHMTQEELRNAKRVPRIKTLRRSLRLTQEEFAARYHIPLGTLRDWEQGRTEPDQTAKAYLKVIAANPEAIYQALQTTPH